MNQYHKNWNKSRKKSIEDWNCLCEYCRIKIAVEIHHIGCSFRGNRDNNPTNLLAVCRDCHNEIHSRNDFLMRSIQKSKVFLILKRSWYEADNADAHWDMSEEEEENTD